MVVFFSSAQSVYFNQFFCPLCIRALPDFGPYQIICWEKHSIDAELAGPAHKFTWHETVVFVWEWVFSVCCVRACQALPLRVNWPTTLCENKDGVHFFTLNFEWHNRYNKLLRCNSENGDFAWCNKNNSEWGFSVFLKKRTKSCFFIKKNKKTAFISTLGTTHLGRQPKLWWSPLSVNSPWNASGSGTNALLVLFLWVIANVTHSCMEIARHPVQLLSNGGDNRNCLK